MDAFLQALTLQAGWNAALVAVAAAMLGFAAGVAGTFLYLRKRSLTADAAAHATLPGLALAWMAAVALGGDGRDLVWLTLGAAVTAGIGLWCVDRLVRTTRLAEDAGVGAVLSAFFGLGVVLLTVIQGWSAGRQAGLEGFLLGQASGMLQADALVIAGGGALCLALLWSLRRGLWLVAFDAGFARAAGMPVARYDAALMLVVTAVTVIGLRLVGVVLIVALLITPAVAARYWTDRAGVMALVAGGIGAAAGWVGAALSSALPGVPTGPVIVLAATAAFAVSMILGPRRPVGARA
jgi:manganese/zinc/iron transport system permease protein